MKIFLVSNHNFPEGMASTACITLMAKGLINNGADLSLISFSQGFNLRDTKHDINQGVYDDIPYEFYNRNATNGESISFNTFKNVSEFSRKLIERKKNGHNDLVIVYGVNYFHYLPLFKAISKHSLNFVAWEVEKRLSSKPQLNVKSYISYLGWLLGERFIKKNAKGIIVISSHLKKYFSQFIEDDRVFLAPIMVDANIGIRVPLIEEINTVKLKFDKLKSKYKVIVYSGTFGDKQGFNYILNAFARYEKENENIILVTTGKAMKHQPIEKILELTKSLGIHHKFVYLGLVSREELKYINQHADLLLVCRENTEFANYGFPWKLGEYVMTKRPVIATRVGDVTQYFDDTELNLAESESSDSIYSQMFNVFDNFELSLDKSKSAYDKAIRVFNHNTITAQCLSYIKNLNFDK